MNTPNHYAGNQNRHESMHFPKGGLMGEELKSVFEASHCSSRKLPRFLLLDDDPALLNALSDTIEFHLGPLTLDVSDSGIKALDLVRVNAYDAMILDVNMPNMNGLEFLNVVKQLRPNTPLFVLMMSAHADDRLMARAFEAGASDFIAKPFDRDKFVSAVKHGLKLSRQSIAIKHDERQLMHTTQTAAMSV
ncbi:response regulator [Nitrospira sp. Nam74]